MNAILSSLLAPEAMATFVLLTGRLGGLMMTSPLWSMRTLPQKARAAITVVLAGILLPACPRLAGAGAAEPFALVAPLALEVTIGLAIGLSASVVVHGLTLAGEVVSMQMGLSLGPALSPMVEAPAEGLSQLQGYFAVFVFVVVGGHLAVLDGVARSLELLPPGAAFDAARGGLGLAHALGAVYTCALSAAAPVLVTLLVTNVAIALLNRAVPQLQSMNVSFPLTISIGLVALGLSAPVLGAVARRQVEAAPRAIEAALEGFVPAGGGR